MARLDFLAKVNGNTIREYVDPKVWKKDEVDAELADIDIVLALTPEQIDALVNTIPGLDPAHQRERLLARKAQLEAMVVYFAAATVDTNVDRIPW